MKKIFLTVFLLVSYLCLGQNNPDRFSDGVATPFIQLDTLTTTQINALPAPLNSSKLVYNKTNNRLEWYNLDTTAWEALGGAQSINSFTVEDKTSGFISEVADGSIIVRTTNGSADNILFNAEFTDYLEGFEPLIGSQKLQLIIYNKTKKKVLTGEIQSFYYLTGGSGSEYYGANLVADSMDGADIDTGDQVDVYVSVSGDLSNYPTLSGNNTFTGVNLFQAQSSSYGIRAFTGSGLSAIDILTDTGAIGLSLLNQGAGTNIQANASSSATGDNYVGRKNGVTNFRVSHDGNVTANSFIGDGSQLTNLPSFDPSANQTITGTWQFNLETIFNQDIELDGTAGIGLSGGVITGIGNAVNPNDVPNLSQVQSLIAASSESTMATTTFTPYSTITSTNGQDAIEELKDEMDAAVIGVGTSAAPSKRTAAGGETTWDVGANITNSHKLFVNGVKLVEDTDYTVSGSIYTFTGYTSVAGHVQESFPDVAVPTTYNADEVTETATRVFVTPAEKASIGTGSSIDWQGTWVSGNYTVDQAVEYNGSSYINILNTVSNEDPTNTTYWNLLAEKGDVGATGSNGANGLDGVGFGYHFDFSEGRATSQLPSQSMYYDALTDEIVMSWIDGNLNMSINKYFGQTKLLSATNSEIRLPPNTFAYVLETELTLTNVPVYYDQYLYFGHFEVAGRIPIAVRPYNSKLIEEVQGIFAEFMFNKKNSYVNKNQNFYSVGNCEKDYTPIVTSNYGIICIGDSILDGRVALADADTWLNQATPVVTDAYLYNYNNDVFNQYEIGVNNGGYFFSDLTWGWDMEVYHKLQTYINEPIYIAKRTLGGTSLIQYWDADFNNINAGFIAMVDDIERRIRSAEKRAIETNINIDWRVLMMSLGSNDVGSNDKELFQYLVERLVDYVRGVVNNPKLRVIIPTVHPSSVRFEPAVYSALLNIEKTDPYFSVIITADSGTVNNDNIHPDASGNIAIGEQVYQEIKEYTQDVVRSVPNYSEKATNTTIINLSNSKGVYYVNSANNSTTYTLSNTHVLGGKATIWINSTSQPTITGATYRTGYGTTYSSSTDLYMKLENIGGTIKYWFETY